MSMKILFAEKDRVFCLRLPLTLLCNRVGAALLASGYRHMRKLPDGSTQVTASQMHGLLQSLRQSKQTLRRAGLPLLDVEERDGSRIVIML